MIELDSKLALELITVKCPISHPCTDLVQAIFIIAAFDWDVRFHLVFREANNCADHLAGLGHKLYRMSFNDKYVPYSLFSLIIYNVNGVSHARLV